MQPHLNPHIVMIVQARMGSTRLPGKILKKVLGHPLLGFELERLRRVKKAQELVVATTTHARDQEIVSFCNNNSYSVFCGSEDDVLSRYFEAAMTFKADVIVRVTADCPLIDPVVIDQVIEKFLSLQPKTDYVSNSLKRTYPRGLDVEVFSFAALDRANSSAHTLEEREHVTPYIWRHPELFSLVPFMQEKNESCQRWTVDTLEDFTLIKKILESVYPKNPEFTKDQVIALMAEHPDWMKINQHVKQKPIGK